MDLFFYGTLRAEQVRTAVLGDHAQHITLCAASLVGYEVRRVTGALYPMICRAESGQEACIEGLVLQQPSDEVVRLLDKFEGEHYRRHTVDVTVSTIVQEAQIYWPDSYLVPAEKWDFEVWKTHHMDDFFKEEFSVDGVHTPHR